MAIAAGRPDVRHDDVDLLLLDQLPRVAAGGGRIGGVVEDGEDDLAAAISGRYATAACIPFA
jgi:hypothetical protein